MMYGQSDQKERARRSFLEEGAWLRFSSPLFSALACECAEDEDMLELGAHARAGQPIGLLVPIVAHFLLLKSPDSQLARYFPSLTRTSGPVSEAFPFFKEFCLDRRQEFIQMLSHRTVNSNLVERSSCIMPALAYVGTLSPEPLTLVEICCSSGLNLLFDEYHYNYGESGELGSDTSAVRLECKVVGTHRPPINAIPRIRKRLGIDLVRIDPSDSSEHLWMEAALCPEWRMEREHLRAALPIRAAHPLEVIEGNALDILPTVLDEVDGSVCVLHSYCMGQWSPAAKSALDEILRRASGHREIHRLGIDTIYQEPPGSTRGRLVKLVAAGIPLTQKSFPSRIEHTRYVRADAHARLLGQADGFGAWIDWEPPSS